MRRLLLTLLFPLLLIAQQGAFVHSLEHLPAGAATSTSVSTAQQGDRHAPADQYCDKCFSFAQIGAAADLPLAVLTLHLSQFDAIGSRLAVALPSPLLSPRSRGPPLPL
jgi:hypothetical protein